MIHYTLLPEKEIRTLKREYFTRFIIVIIFFVSLAILSGILSLVPSYMKSYVKEQESLKQVESLQKGRQARGTDAITTELGATYKLIKSVKEDGDSVSFAESISDIVNLRTPQIFYSSMSIQKADKSATSSLTVIIQGKAVTRDSLIKFKKNVEANPNVSRVDLPISDLAKSKDITFAVRFLLKK